MLKKLSKSLLIAFAALSLVAVSAQADSKKGQKIIIKKLKKDCGFNGAILAAKHTQNEWKSINEQGGLNDEILKLCPKAEPLKDSYIPHVYDFLFDYAKDSGNVPSC